MKTKATRVRCVGLLVSFLVSCLLASILFCSTALAEINGLRVEEVYDLTNSEMYRLEDREYSGGWKGVAGHRLSIRLSGAEGFLTYKSSQKSVAKVSKNGIITCVKNGITFITVTDTSNGNRCSFRLRVLKNQNPSFMLSSDAGGRYGSWEYSRGIFTYSKAVYLKGNNLYADLWVCNNTPSSIKGKLGTTEIYLACYWNDDYLYEDFRDFDGRAYRRVGVCNVKIPRIRPYSHKAITVKIGKVDKTSIYLRNAYAYLKGGFFQGDIDWHGFIG